tara:strand:+ start:594 stop:977 length:384 start_codon:yes stop_codon:yes gene_type:complete
MSDKIKLPTNRNFGIVFSIVFIIIAIFPLLNQNDIRYWSLIISIIFLFLAIIKSEILTPLNKIWFKFGILLGKVISPIVMGVIFFFVITPIGVFMRLIGKDILNIKKNQNKSYWSKRANTGSMKRQF